MSFKLCCDEPKKTKYTLLHSSISTKTKIDLFELVCYLPEMESYQSKHDTIFSNNVYDEYLYKLFLNEMGMSDDDVNVVEKSGLINKSDGDYFKSNICIKCQKIIFQKKLKLNRVQELFRHIRNSVSHGCFNIVSNCFIGFDHPKYGSEEYTAVIKVKYDRFVSTIKKIRTISTAPDLFKEVLTKFGYEVFHSDKETKTGDLFVKKDGILYCFEFKQFNGRYINQNDVMKVIYNIRCIEKNNYIYVLVVDSTYTNTKINLIVKNYNLSIIDKKFLKEMLNGKDIFEEIRNAILK